MWAGIIFGLGAVAICGAAFRRGQPLRGRIPGMISVLVILGMLALPILLAWVNERVVLPGTLTVLWLFLGAGIGEEIFFRGYLQSRLDLSFGLPFQWGAFRFGLGLIMGSLLFGFLHALNTVNYFEGRFDFGWGFAVQNFFWGLFYGCLRLKTGSVTAGAVTHGLADVLGTIPQLILDFRF